MSRPQRFPRRFCRRHGESHTSATWTATISLQPRHRIARTVLLRLYDGGTTSALASQRAEMGWLANRLPTVRPGELSGAGRLGEYASAPAVEVATCVTTSTKRLFRVPRSVIRDTCQDDLQSTRPAECKRLRLSSRGPGERQIFQRAPGSLGTWLSKLLRQTSKDRGSAAETTRQPLGGVLPACVVGAAPARGLTSSA
jgi:hypothetical protein